MSNLSILPETAMQKVCSNCGVAMNGPDATCVACAEAADIHVESAVDRFAAALAYVGLLPAVIFLFLGRFKNNQFVRFHCFQSIFLVVAAALLAVVVRLFFVSMPGLPFLPSALVITILCLGIFLLWIVLLLKALQGRPFALPWIGVFAKRYSYASEA